MGAVAGQAVALCRGGVRHLALLDAIVTGEAELFCRDSEKLARSRIVGFVAVGAGAIPEGWMEGLVFLDGGVVAVAA